MEAVSWTGVAAAVLVALLLRRLLARRGRVEPAGRAVLITGCDTGFGNAAARKLSQLGYTCIATCYSADSLQQFASVPSVEALQMDVTSADSVEECLAAVRKILDDRRLQLLAVVNNAGLARGSLIDITPAKAFDDNMQVNYVGMVRVTYAFLPLLKRTRGARVVNVSSPAGLTALPTSAAYSASKAAVESYSHSLRWEVERLWGVSVVVIRPGAHRTPILDMVGQEQLSGADPARAAEYGDGFLSAMRGYVALGHKFAGAPDSGAAAIVEAATAEKPPRELWPGRDSYFWRVLSSSHALRDLCFARFLTSLPSPDGKR